MAGNRVHGDLNNTEVMRETNFLVPDPAYAGKSLAIPENEDDADIRSKYRPFITSPEVANSDWISKSELSTVLKMSETDMAKTGGDRLKILVLYGSLRERLDPSIFQDLLWRLLIRCYQILLAVTGL